MTLTSAAADHVITRHIRREGLLVRMLRLWIEHHRRMLALGIQHD